MGEGKRMCDGLPRNGTQEKIRKISYVFCFMHPLVRAQSCSLLTAQMDEWACGRNRERNPTLANITPQPLRVCKNLLRVMVFIVVFSCECSERSPNQHDPVQSHAMNSCITASRIRDTWENAFSMSQSWHWWIHEISSMNIVSMKVVCCQKH